MTRWEYCSSIEWWRNSRFEYNEHNTTEWEHWSFKYNASI